MPQSAVATFPSGIRYLIPEELKLYFSKEGGEPERELIEWARRFLRADGVFVDIGAHIGTYALNLASEVRETHCFEPEEDTFMRLCGGIALSGNGTIHAHRAALSNERGGSAKLRVLSSDGGLSSICDLPTNKTPLRIEEVPLRTLDGYFLKDVCLIKIDVEGNERNVILGARETLKNSGYPPMLVEVWTEEWFSEERGKLLELLAELGYETAPAPGFPHMLCATHASRKEAPSPKLEPVAADREDKTRVILTMIVKNEVHVLPRLFASVLGMVDAYAISDTGSTDGTQALIARECEKVGVRGRVSRDEWENYGQNRTRSVALAREIAESLGWPLERTYALLLDADMTFRAPGGFDKSALRDDAYYIVQKNSGMSYANTRLVRLDKPWRSIGVTHEYWAAEGASLGPELEGVCIEDGNDGGNRHTKFQRDRVLLEEGLRNEPDNERYMFYLAETYAALGEADQALEWYQKRASAKSTHWEETWYARFRSGKLLLDRGDASGVGVLLGAYEEQPGRVEPLFYLVEYYRARGENKLAAIFLRMAREVPPAKHGFMLESNIFEWRLDYEESIVGYYAGSRASAGKAADRVARSLAPGVPQARAFENLMHFTEPLARLDGGNFSVPLALRIDAMGVKNESSSATIVRQGDAFVVGIRLVNYTHERGIAFISRAEDSVIRSREVVGHWGRKPSVATEFTEIAQTMPADWPKAAVLGMEDQRFVEFRGRIYFTANTWQSPLRPGTPQMVLGRLSKDLGEVERVIPLRYDQARPIEKNWLPFVYRETLRVIYGYDPLVVLTVDLETGECTEVARHPMPWYSARFRGSAGPLLLVRKDASRVRWLLVHEVTAIEGQRIYGQRLLELDLHFKPLRLSAPLYLDHRGVEYPLGLARWNEEELVITYGREERESCYAIVSIAELEARLSP